MWPHSLLFSSDEKTAQALTQALHELEFEVETCAEIFTAVEKITSRGYEVVVSDWHEGLEAAFLLKTTRELKANQAAFTIAIAHASVAAAAREAGADLVLSRPLAPQEVKCALLTCDPFLEHMQSWLPRNEVPVVTPSRPRMPLPSIAQTGVGLSQKLRAWPSPPSRKPVESVEPVVPAAESIFQDDLLYQSHWCMPSPGREPSFSSAAPLTGRKATIRLLPSLAIAVAFLSVGYVFSEPLRGQGTHSVAQLCGRVLQRTHAWLNPATVQESHLGAVQIAEDRASRPARPGWNDPRIRVTPAPDPYRRPAPVKGTQSAAALHVEASEPAPQSSSAATQVRIPDSLQNPVQNATMRNVARITPSLLAALEPVALSEDISRQMLLEKVLPSYPEEAIRARLQGPVVLQAWIGRDGTIQDVKLLRGSLLLGQAAYQAVRQWRYQPYLINGRAVEAQTLVTVDFKLP